MNLWRAEWRGPVLAALLTAAVFTAVLMYQQSRGRWPFEALGRPIGEASASGGVAQDRVAVQVTREIVDRLEIKVEDVRSDQSSVTVRAVATIALDESRISHIHTRVPGWVEQLYVNTTGQAVRAGQPVARIFSQELLSSQSEYLTARRFAASGFATSVVSSGRTRLKVLGMTDGEVRSIERSGQPLRLVTVTAPRGGVVVNRGVSVGTAVDPSTELLTLADLSSVWVFAEIPEKDVRSIRPGATALLDFPASGRPPFPARVDFVYPTLTERTRTLRVRLAIPNPHRIFVPGLYGTAVFELPAGRAIMVPRDAVVDTGRRQHVFVVRGNSFEPRVVTLGARVADRVVITSGLTEGERIAVSGTFLLDSESRLRATGGAGSHGAHGSTPAAQPEPSAPSAEAHPQQGTTP